MHKACMWCHFPSNFMFIFKLKCCVPLCKWRKLYYGKTELLHLFQGPRDIHNENRLTLFTSQMCPVHFSARKAKKASSPDRRYGNFSLQDSSWRHVTSPEGSWRFCLRLVRHRSWTGSQSISPDGSKQVCFSALEWAAIKLKAKSYRIWNTGCSCGVCVCTLYI